MSVSAIQVLGWSQGMDKYGDPRPIAHLVITKGTAFSRLACGSNARVYGSVYKQPQAGPCTRCEAWARGKGAPATERAGVSTQISR